MKFQRTPLFLVLIASLLGGFVYFHEMKAPPKQDTTKAPTNPLFAFKAEEIQAFTLMTKGKSLSFVKAPEMNVTQKPGNKPEAGKSSVPIWVMTAPKHLPANDASVVYLLNLIVTGKGQQPLMVPSSRRAEFGLDQPLATIEVRLNNQQSHRLVLGKPNFNRSSLYALIDPTVQPNAELSVVLVSMDFESAVNRPIAEWQHSPETTDKTPKVQSGKAN
jgi:hypothetical protein